jgi:hypothetical protein
MSNQFLINALSNYDTIRLSSSNYNLIGNDIKNFKLEYKNNKMIVENTKKYDYQFIGIYEPNTSIWIWAYTFCDSKFNKILFWANHRLINQNNTMIDNIINTTFNNSKFIISDDLQLDIILALALYLYKSDFIFDLKLYGNYIFFVSVKEID